MANQANSSIISTGHHLWMAQNSQLVPLPDSQKLKIYAPENQRYQFNVASQPPMFKGDVSFRNGYLPPPPHPPKMTVTKATSTSILGGCKIAEVILPICSVVRYIF